MPLSYRINCWHITEPSFDTWQLPMYWTLFSDNMNGAANAAPSCYALTGKLSAAAAVVVSAATAAAVVTAAAAVTAATEQDKNENDDPAAVAAAKVEA